MKKVPTAAEIAERIRIGKRIKELREAAKLSQADLSAAIAKIDTSLKISQQHIALIESSKGYNITLDTLTAISTVLNVQVDFFRNVQTKA